MPDQKISDCFDAPISDKPSAGKPPSIRNNMRLFVSVLSLATILLAAFAHRTPNASQEVGRNSSTAELSLQPPTFNTVVELSQRANSSRLKADKIINPLERAVYQGIFHLALKVDDLNATYTYLGHRGVTLVAPPSCVDPYGCSAFVADPEENLIEIVHYNFD
ncbi:MAG: hypothetical protein Q9191_002125 [Dirinaria sp. TL-2023a]